MVRSPNDWLLGGLSLFDSGAHRPAQPGVKDTFFVVCDGIKGLSEVVGNVWPAAIVQTWMAPLTHRQPTLGQLSHCGPVEREIEKTEELGRRRADRRTRGRAHSGQVDVSRHCKSGAEIALRRPARGPSTVRTSASKAKVLGAWNIKQWKVALAHFGVSSFRSFTAANNPWPPRSPKVPAWWR